MSTISAVDRKVYIVTGSSSGVGAATAVALAARGGAVVINYSRNAAAAKTVAENCIQAGGEAIAIRANVAADDDCRKLVQAAMEHWGRLDGLVNNAGTTRFVTMHKLDELSAADFHHLCDVNTIGPFQMVRAGAAALRASRGAIVNVSSTAATTGSGSSIAYACSKGALNTLTLSLARILAPEVRVNAVLPGFIETRWLRQGLGDELYKKAEANWRGQVALGAVLTPEDVAGSILSLLDATKMTGQLLTLDCGKAIGQ